jgi:hypothetical protein
LEQLVGKEVAGKLSPIAGKALEEIVNSKAGGKAIHQLGNRFFGKKKPARKLLNIGKKLSSVAFSDTGKQTFKSGLGLAKSMGLISDETASDIESGYSKAMSMHDQLSQINHIKNNKII